MAQQEIVLQVDGQTIGKAVREAQAAADIDSLAAPLIEAGRVLSSKNEAALRKAVGELQAILNQLSKAEPEPEAEPMMEADTTLACDIREETFPGEDYAPGVSELREAASGKGPLMKLIAPGWGSSGHYSPEVLKADGPSVFRAGTLNFWNHLTEAEERARPEGSMDNLASVLTEDARYMDDGPDGPGLYAPFKAFTSHAQQIKEKGPHTGVSIRAAGRYREGEAGGRKGKIIEKLVAGHSVDYVTRPGAGGRVILTESARPTTPETPATSGPGTQEASMALDEKEAEALREAIGNKDARIREITERLSKLETDNARLQEGQIFRDAQDIATEILEKVPNLPQMTQRRIAESIAKDPPVKDGKVNREVFAPLVEGAARREMAYLANVLKSGRITGFGPAADDSPAADPAKAQASLKESLQSLGLTEHGAKYAAERRAV